MLKIILRTGFFRQTKRLSRLILTSACILSCHTVFADGNLSTLTQIKERGELICGVKGDFSSMSEISKSGQWRGFDVDFCRAVAAAVLGNAQAVDFIALSPRARFTALINKEIDVLIRNSTWTFQRDTGMPIEFVGINLYDGQGFITTKNLKLLSIKDVKPGTTICVQEHTTTETNLITFNDENDLKLSINTFSSSDQAVATFLSGKCKIYTGDMSDLISLNRIAPIPGDYIILPHRISKEVMGPIVRDSDAQWVNIVRWVLYLTIEAEEKGITSQNVKSLLNSTDPSIRYILGADPGIGSRVGLDDKWALRVLTSVGNYGEIFDRNFTVGGERSMDRGFNRLWNEGGLLYSPPLR